MWQILTDYSTFLVAVLSFLAGLLSAELTEWRRRWIRKNNIRKALIGELRILEPILSITLIRFSYGRPDPTQAVAEYRWYLAKGRKQWGNGLILDNEQATTLNKLTDDQLKNLITNSKNPEAGQCAKFKVPILDGVLSSVETGFSSDEIEILSKVRWQLTLAEREIDIMDKFLALTFTTTNERNYKLAVENVRAAKDGFRERLGFAVSEVRAALSKLNKPAVLSSV